MHSLLVFTSACSTVKEQKELQETQKLALKKVLEVRQVKVEQHL